MGDVPLHFGTQVHGLPGVLVQTCPGGQKRLPHWELPPQAGPHPHAFPSSPVQTSPEIQSPAHIGAVPPHGTPACTRPGCAVVNTTTPNTTSQYALPHPPISIRPSSDAVGSGPPNDVKVGLSCQGARGRTPSSIRVAPASVPGGARRAPQHHTQRARP